jgi:hypothetical protein
MLDVVTSSPDQRRAEFRLDSRPLEVQRIEDRLV